MQEPQLAQYASKPTAKPTQASLQEQLKTRLRSDASQEVQETIRSLLNSLQETSRPSPAPAVQSSLKNEKGKGRETRPNTPAKEPRNVDEALAVIHDIEVSFNNLASDFVFPSQLDFTPTSSPPSSPVHSDAESSVTRRLAFTSRNSPVKYYEQALTGLLLKLDNVESFGSEDLRHKRKDVVNRIERAIEELEGEVDGRWRSKLSQEQGPAPQVEATPSSDQEDVAVAPIQTGVSREIYETQQESSHAAVSEASTNFSTAPTGASHVEAEPSTPIPAPGSPTLEPTVALAELATAPAPEEPLNPDSSEASHLPSADSVERNQKLSSAFESSAETEELHRPSVLADPSTAEHSEQSALSSIPLENTEEDAVPVMQETGSPTAPTDLDPLPESASHSPSLSALPATRQQTSSSSALAIEALSERSPASYPPSLSASITTIKGTTENDDSFLQSAYPPTPQIQRPAHSDEDSDWSDIGTD